MAQNFNILQASLAIVLPSSLSMLMEANVSVQRIEDLMLLGTILNN